MTSLVRLILVLSSISLILIIAFSLMSTPQVDIHYKLLIANFSTALLISAFGIFIGLKFNAISVDFWILTYLFLAVYYLIVYPLVLYQEPGSGLMPDSVDNLFYHNNALTLLHEGFLKGAESFLEANPYDDFLVVVYVYIAYSIAEEPIVVYFFNCVLIFISLIYMKKISKNVFFLPEKTFLLSSVIVAPLLLSFALTHYKESLLIFFFIGFCYYLFKVSKSKSIKNISGLIFFCFGLFLLRTILIPIFLFSFVIVEVDRSIRALSDGKLTLRTFLVLMFSMIFLLLILDVIFSYVSRFSFVLSTGESLKTIPIAGELGRLASIVLALFGPLSDFVSVKGSEIKGVVGPGVFFIVSLSAFFMISVFNFIVFKADYLGKVFMWFVVLHSLALGIIFRGFDPRFSVFQKPLVVLFSMVAAIYILKRINFSQRTLVFLSISSFQLISTSFFIYQLI